MLRVNTPLDAKTESIVEAVIGCGLMVHRELGPGFVETIYRRAMCLELNMLGIPFECEKSISVRYRGHQIPGQRLDLLVAGCVVVEIKATPCLESIQDAQLTSYLKTTGLRVGLLMNFGGRTLREGLKQIVR